MVSRKCWEAIVTINKWHLSNELSVKLSLQVIIARYEDQEYFPIGSGWVDDIYIVGNYRGQKGELSCCVWFSKGVILHLSILCNAGNN